MYKVLIIDDEEPVREAIRLLGDWEALKVDGLLEASNGAEGLAMLAVHKIDLVMVDMKMPEMNGVAFLQKIEEEYPELLTVVISGFNDFEYTRQAIRSRVVDYLLKPINRHDLGQTLRKAIDLLDAKRRRESEFISNNITLNLSLPKLKEKMYWSVIERSFKQQSNEAFLPLIGADRPDNRFAVVLVRLLNLDEVKERRFRNDSELLYFAVANVLSEMADEHFRSFSFANPRQEREMIVVLTIAGGYRTAEMDYHAVQKAGRALSTLQQLFGISSVAGYGGARADILSIADSYEAAKSALNGIDLLALKSGTVASGGQTGPQAQEKDSYAASLTGRIASIRTDLESGNAHYVRNAVDDLLKKRRTAGQFGLGEADRALNEWMILMNDLALELGADPDRLPLGGLPSLKIAGLSADYGSFEQYGGLLHALLDHYAAEIRKSRSASRPFDIADIKHYIENHYYEDIKISMFTEKYYLSREYLMKLFKQQYGYGIHEYVQKVRMEKAKELLADPALKIQDISEMLGYRDKNYFSKAFRNYYGQSPTEYRSEPQPMKE